jgi:vitamin B12/bleomycin/antimicrobial peptide transport system ATP-binding/permease protein
MMFISPIHYIPPGTLRGALAYPSPPSEFTSEEYAAALQRTQLAHLATGLDRVARWEQEFNRDEQNRFGLARLLLRKPHFILLDEALDQLDAETRALVFDVGGKELAEAAIINIGQAYAYGGFFTRHLHLIQDPEGRRLVHHPPLKAAVTMAKEKAPAH